MCNENSSPDIKSNKELREKWRFVRNAMDNMERQKKHPLQDKTSSILNQQRESANFVQIQ